MIPKIIHYCWFGKKPLPEITLKCIESWKKYCPDYQIIEWNESNFNIKKNDYISEAYNQGKYAFVADYARFEILYANGGIYLDTDVELIKNIDIFLPQKVFFGREEIDKVNPGLIMGAEKGNPFLKQMILLYNSIEFNMNDPKFKNVVEYTSEMLLTRGWKPVNKIQHLENIVIYPIDYFAPKDYLTGKINITQNTYSIHHYDQSWISNESKRLHFLVEKYTSIFGVFCGGKIARLVFEIEKRVKK